MILVEHSGLSFRVGEEWVELLTPAGTWLAVANRKDWDSLMVPAHRTGIIHSYVMNTLEAAGFGEMARELRRRSASNWRTGRD
jgi:hypothetical protein